MKKWLGVFLMVMALVIPQYGFTEEALAPPHPHSGIVGGRDGASSWRLGIFDRLIFPEISAPSGNPATNTGWLYVKASGVTTALYFEDDAGSVVNLGTQATPSLSAITAPTAAKTIAMGTFAITLTSAKTDGDMFTLEGIGAFGDYSVLHVKSSTGNASDGTILKVTSHDAQVDPLVVISSTNTPLTVNAAGTVTLAGNTTISGKLLGETPLILEGTTADGTNVVTVTVTDPTAARTLTIPDASGSVTLLATASHNYATAHADWTLSVDEQQASYLTATNADAGANILLSAAIPGKCYFVNNASGQILTFKVTGQTGGTIANAKRAYYCSDAVDLYEIWEQS